MPPAFQLPLASLGEHAATPRCGFRSIRRRPTRTGAAAINVAYARRKPGVSLEQAKADAKRVATAVAAIDPARYRNYTAGVADLREATIGCSARASAPRC